MRHTLYLLAMAAILVVACSKTKKSRQVYGGCIQRTTIDDPADLRMSAEDSAYGLSLMKKWWAPYKSFRLIKVERLPYTMRPVTHLVVQQYIDGLPLLSNTMMLSFTDDSLTSVSGRIKSTTLDTVRSLTPDSIKAIYFALIAREPGFIKQEATQYRCLTAIAGYYDLNTGSGNDTVKIVKAWKVHPSEDVDPVALINDNGNLIYFFNGIYH